MNLIVRPSEGGVRFQRDVVNAVAELHARIAFLEGQLQDVHASEPQLVTPEPNLPFGTYRNVSTSGNYTLAVEDLFTWHFVNCTSAADITLSPAWLGAWVGLFNRGAEDITVKAVGGTTICTLKQYQYVVLYCLIDSSGIAAWPTGAVVVGADGSLYMTGEVISRDYTKGIQLKDSAGHWWRLTVDTSGVWVAADLGTSEQAESEPVL